MLTILVALLLAAPSDAPSDAETFAAAATAHLQRAATAEHPLEEYDGAHKNFDNAYLVADDVRYLCRALAVVELTLARAPFGDDQERLSWEDLRRDDLERLRDDANQNRRANCRFDASGKAAPRVALLDADAPVTLDAVRPSASSPPSSASTNDRPPAAPTPAQERRFRAHTASGVLLTTAGLGLLGGAFGVLGVELQRAAEMRSLIDTAHAERRNFTTPEDQRFNDLKGDLLRGRDVAIGVGVAGVVITGIGAAVLATRKRAARGYAFLPYGGVQGAGAVLRLKF